MFEHPLYLEYRPGIQIPYEEELDEDGYTYHFLIEWKDREGLVFICDSGMHIEWEDTPGWIISNIIPRKVFGKLPKLETNQMRYLLRLFSQTGFEGWHLSAEEEEKMYQKWKELGEP